MSKAIRSSTTAALAVHPAAPSRRSLSAMAGGLLLLAADAMRAARGTPAAQPMDDAGLVRLCAEFHDADARCHAAPDDSNEWRVWLDHRWEITTAIENITPTTSAGRQAKARVALVLLEEAADTENEYERFTLATMRDLAGAAA